MTWGQVAGGVTDPGGSIAPPAGQVADLPVMESVHPEENRSRLYKYVKYYYNVLGGSGKQKLAVCV